MHNMLDNLKRLIDVHQIISFDIFDTLIIRAYDKPTDLFRHIEISKNVKDFQYLRQTAETNARRKALEKGVEETSLDDIYCELPDDLSPIKTVEVAQEINVCFQDKYMHEVFEYAKAQNKKVVLASDMYLKKETIEAILKKNDYAGYDELFLSSDIKLSKASGHLYEEMMRRFHCKPSDILHIGDNHYGDYKMPSRLGIDCWLYETAKSINARKETKRFVLSFSEHCDEIPISIAKSLILKRNFDQHDAWEDFGYKYAGLMLYGYCDWLDRQFQEQNLHQLIFASRDGYIPMQIFQQYYPQYDCRYFYASRRAYLFSGLKEVDDIFLTYLVDQAGSGLTFGAYWESLKIDDDVLSLRFRRSFDWEAKLGKSDKQRIRNFFIDNQKELFRYAKEERKASINYFEKIGLLDEKVAFVDIGWRASIQRSVINTIAQAGKQQNISGFYLATHPVFGDENMSVKAFLMNESQPSYIAELVNPVMSVFELIFSAPHLGCLKISQKDATPLLQQINPVEQARMDANKGITTGILEFINDYKQITDGLPVSVSPLACVIPFVHFFNALNQKTWKALSSVGYVTGIGDVQNYVSLIPYCDREKTIAVVYTWPGVTESGEIEFLNRFKVAATNIGYNVAVISKERHILDENYQVTPQILNDENLKFLLIIHYEDFKNLDTLTYKALWNPPSIPLQYDSYPHSVKNIISNDDFLIYDDGGMSDHLRAMVIDTPRHLEGASSLTASFPATSLKKPELKDPTLFYCGINWERMVGTEPRHEGLFHQLDELGNVNFYGPSSNWQGYKSYKGSIPFDGFSLVEEAHKCGVVLALSSDFHYRAGAATNRVYEGCAAGAVIISDTNRFIKKHFGDSILYIDFDKDHPERMFRQIKQHLDWIRCNRDAALELARKAQNIFLERFTLEKQITAIVNNHENRKKAVAEALYARNNETKTLAVHFVDSVTFGGRERELLENTLKNISKQYDKNIVLAVCCDKSLESEVQCFISSMDVKANIHINAYPIFDGFQYKWMTRGQMLFDVIHQIPHEYLCILDGYENMFRDHITTLKRTLEDHPDKVAAYSGTFLDSQDTNRYRILNGCIKPQEIYDCFWPDRIQNVSGMFLMHKKAESILTKPICSCLDGLEVSALLNVAYFKLRQEFAYSERMTCGCHEALIASHPMTMDRAKQINFIHGLIVYEYELWHSQHLNPSQSMTSSSPFSAVERRCREWLYKMFQLKLKYHARVLKFYLLFTRNYSKRERIKGKIRRMGDEFNQMKQARKRLCI